jgi:hypothetical protein
MFFIYLSIEQKRNYANHEKIAYDYNNIKKKFKTGDIIMFSYGRYRSLLEELGYLSRTKLFGTIYGHIGIVLREGNKLYLIECTSSNHTAKKYAYTLNNENRGGVRIIDLDILIREYHDEEKGIFAVKFADKEIPNKLIMCVLEKYGNVIFENIPKIALFVVANFISNKFSKKLAKTADNNRMTCSEFAYELLYQCGYVEKYQSKLIWPHLFSNGQFDKLTKIKYSKPIGFIYK